jgi:hypothetical protein
MTASSGLAGSPPQHRFDALEHRINIASRTSCLTGASTPVAVTVPPSDRLTSSHLWCTWLGLQFLLRALSPLGRSQERRRIAAAGRAYTLPASRIILLREASFSVLPGLSDRKAPEL